MPLSVDVFWSFRSPYSYLATPRLVRLAKLYKIDVKLRPVLPLAVRSPDFFKRVDPLWPAYLLRDTRRIADHQGIDFSWPRPDPVVMDPKTGSYPKEQPYIHRLTRLGVEAALRERGVPFIDEISQIIWNGKVASWHQGAHLADAAARAGLDLGEMDRAIEADPARYDQRIERNHRDLADAGHLHSQL